MAASQLDQVRIVLVEPAGPRNIGAIARVMKNMGLSRLILVSPHCDPLGDEARHMAVHAADILEAVTIVPTVPDALVGCQRAIATTGKVRTLVDRLEPPRTALPWLTAPGITSALLFGPEDRGLSNLELNYAQRFIYIPTHPDYPSMNLAQAVGVCCYELYQHELAASAIAPEPQATNPRSDSAMDDATVNPHSAAIDHLERYYRDLEALLLKIGYLYPHTASSRMEKIRRLYSRGFVSDHDVSMLHGMIRQMEWALDQLKN